MAISKRKLMAWRTEALKQLAERAKANAKQPQRFAAIHPAKVTNERILTLTQELIDQHLLAETHKEK